MKPGTEKTEHITIILEDIPTNGIPDGVTGQNICFVSDQTSHEPDKQSARKKNKYADSRSLPWFIDLFLYPLNATGVINLIGLWLLIFWACPFVINLLGLGIEYIPIVYVLPVAYVLYYFTECLRDSAAGKRRAPDIWMELEKFDKWDCYTQLILVVGCIAACFCPAIAYHAFAMRNDWIYWLMLGCGVFFFPMILLAAVLFDSLDALNPILIIPSVIRTFVPYCGMVLILCGGGFLFIKFGPRIFTTQFISWGAFFSKALLFYLILTTVGLLGRFFRKYKAKLEWEVE
jgi:hypothetical protein